MHALGPNPEGSYPFVRNIRHLPRIAFFTVNYAPHEVARASDMPLYRGAFEHWAHHADVVGVCVDHHGLLNPADIVLAQGRRLHYFEPRARFMGSDHVGAIDGRLCPVVWFEKEALRRAIFSVQTEE